MRIQMALFFLLGFYFTSFSQDNLPKYAIVLSSVLNQNDANKMVQTFQNKGLEVRIFRMYASNRMRYRIATGEYYNLKMASDALQETRRKSGVSDAWILNVAQERPVTPREIKNSQAAEKKEVLKDLINGSKIDSSEIKLNEKRRLDSLNRIKSKNRKDSLDRISAQIDSLNLANAMARIDRLNKIQKQKDALKQQKEQRKIDSLNSIQQKEKARIDSLNLAQRIAERKNQIKEQRKIDSLKNIQQKEQAKIDSLNLIQVQLKEKNRKDSINRILELERKKKIALIRKQQKIDSLNQLKNKTNIDSSDVEPVGNSAQNTQSPEEILRLLNDSRADEIIDSIKLKERIDRRRDSILNPQKYRLEVDYEDIKDYIMPSVEDFVTEKMAEVDAYQDQKLHEIKKEIAQKADQKEEDKKGIKLTAYADAYYAFDNDNLADETRQLAVTNFGKDVFGLNMAQIKANYNHEKFRGKLAIHFGDIRETLYDNRTRYPILQEGNAGVKLFKNLWLDAGYFQSHIGKEKLLPKDNWFSTYTIGNIFQPFYQSGIRMSYNFSEKLKTELYLVNGYGIFEDNNKNKSIGWTVDYKSEKFGVYYAGLAGNERFLDGPSSLLVYHNIILNFKATDWLEFKGQGNFVSQDISERSPNGTFSTAQMQDAHFEMKIKGTNYLNLIGRIEYFSNPDSIFNVALEGIGFSGGLEFIPHKNSYIRLETRQLQLKDQYLFFQESNGRATNQRLEFGITLGVWFEE